MKRMPAKLIALIMILCLIPPVHIQAVDTESPYMKYSRPANNTTNVSINPTIKITFNENIYKTNNFNNILFATEQASEQNKVSYRTKISKNVLYIKPLAILKNNTKYILSIPLDAIVDKSGYTMSRIIFLSFTTVGMYPDNTKAVFPDPVFEAAVRKAANKAEGTLYYKDVKAVSAIDNMEGATSIEGIQYLTGLFSVNISSKVLDLSPLTKGSFTELTSLSYGYNADIKDISALASLKSLVRLEIPYTSVEDLSALKGMTDLEYLFLNENMVSDITPLSNLKKLKYLELSCNRIQDISTISQLDNLEVFSAGANMIEDITSLSKLGKLYEINLYWNNITDISALSNLKELKVLRISLNDIQNLQVLSEIYDSLTDKDFYLDEPDMVKYGPNQYVFLKKAVNRVDSAHAIFVSDSEVSKERLQIYADKFENTIYTALAKMIPDLSNWKEKTVFLFVNCRDTKNPSMETIKYWGASSNFPDYRTYLGEDDPVFSSFNGVYNAEGYSIIKDKQDYNFSTLAHEYIHFINNTLVYHKNCFDGLKMTRVSSNSLTYSCTGSGISTFIDEAMSQCISKMILNDKKEWQMAYIVNELYNISHNPDLNPLWDGDMNNCHASGISFAYLCLSQGMDKIYEYIKLTSTHRDMEDNFTTVFGLTPQEFAKQLKAEIDYYIANPGMIDDLKIKVETGQRLPGWMGNY